MRGTTVLKEEKPLPGAEHHAPVNHRDILVHVGKAHANVRWHVIAALIGMHKIRRILGNKVIKKGMQVSACRRIGILHHHQ